MFLYLYIHMYNCMFVSALPGPTCNSAKSANGGNKQILLLLLLLLSLRWIFFYFILYYTVKLDSSCSSCSFTERNNLTLETLETNGWRLGQPAY